MTDFASASALDPDATYHARRTLGRRPKLAQHSNASPDWGSPILMRLFADRVLGAVRGGRIDLDYSSSAYWQDAWPEGTRPLEYMDGSFGSNVFIGADRLRFRPDGGVTGFWNPPGLDAGRAAQMAWNILDADHRSGWINSAVWVNFSIEQFASLQNTERTAKRLQKADPNDVSMLPEPWRAKGERRHPLSSRDGITTFVPSRRARYLLHPLALIAIISKKLGRKRRATSERVSLEKHLRQLIDRDDDSPVQGDAPPHASALTVLWDKHARVRKRQMKAARLFLDEQSKVKGSLFERVAVIGEI